MKTILIADGDAGFRGLLREALRRSRDAEGVPYRPLPEAASTGVEAVELAVRFRPDAVLMDWLLPVLGGIGATRALRERGVESLVILVTLNGDELPEWLVRDGGVAAVVAKGGPGFTDRVVELLRELL